jgi:asparagine synthase (glutamine-hydrolysing)
MCGLAGIVDLEPADPAGRARQVTRMREALGHRGPVGWGVAALHGATVERHSAAGTETRARASGGTASVWFGHQRLAIIDPSAAGAQPMRSVEGAGWLTFNGEIYNYRDVQARFAAAPDANSDTAVLLEALVAHGLDVLPHLRGMFAFAYWNETERALYLVRDRFGIKPMYWCRPSPGVLAFASEPRALVAAGFGGAYRADMDAAFLRRGHVPPGQSAFEGINVLPPGCWLRFDGSRLDVTRWFETTSVFGARRTQPVEEAARAFEAALDDSVRAHLVSDVPVGVFLSGGLDSAAIVASAHRIGAAGLRTFTVSVPGSSIDESAPAARIAREFGTDHTEVTVAPDELAGWLEDGLDAMGDPTFDGLNTFMVSRAVARAGLKVVLSGLGGDEVLGGYPSFRDVPRLWRATAPFRAGLPGRGLAAGLARFAPVNAPGKLAEIMRAPAATRAGLWRQYRSLLERDQVRRISGVEAPPDDQAPDDPGMPMLDVVSRCEIEEFMEPQLLRDADVFSMCDSLELRVPFVDDVFIRRVRAGGWWARGAHQSHKAAIFAAMPHALPADHLSRKKTGFMIPMGDWLRAALGGDRRLTILSTPLARPALAPYVAAFLAGRLDPGRLWALVVREHFLARYPRP